MTFLSDALAHWQAGPQAMNAALGCAICSSTKKDEWFVQLRIPPEAGLFAAGVVLTSVFGVGREETIEKARLAAGVEAVVPWTSMAGAGTPGVVQGDKRRDGLIAALAMCEAACDALRHEISRHHDGI